jgi:Icc-related predicted phosphoesterase
MKLLHVTDLHGVKWKYERILRIAEYHKVSIVVNCGDMLPKEDPFGQGQFIREYLDDYFAHLERKGIFYLCYLGNDDLQIFDERFEETCRKYTLIINLAQRKCTIGGYEFIGMNLVVDYPFRLKDRCRKDTKDYLFQRQFGKGLLSTNEGWQELDDWFGYAETLPSIADELEKLEQPEDITKTIYVIHMPPYSLGLDKCRNGEEVGSKAVYDFLLKKQPLLSLHGHIHESPNVTNIWWAWLGSTICVQPGQYDNRLTCVIIDMSSMTLERIVE